MDLGKVNTIASVAAAFFGLAALGLEIWQAGADGRKTAAFRDDCRSHIGAEINLVGDTEIINRHSFDFDERWNLQRRWQLLAERLEALRALGPSTGLERQAVDGITDAADLADQWSKRGDLFNVDPSVQDAIAKAAALSRKILTKAAGEVN